MVPVTAPRMLVCTLFHSISIEGKSLLVCTTLIYKRMWRWCAPYSDTNACSAGVHCFMVSVTAPRTLVCTLFHSIPSFPSLLSLRGETPPKPTPILSTAFGLLNVTRWLHFKIQFSKIFSLFWEGRPLPPPHVTYLTPSSVIWCCH